VYCTILLIILSNQCVLSKLISLKVSDIDRLLSSIGCSFFSLKQQPTAVEKLNAPNFYFISTVIPQARIALKSRSIRLNIWGNEDSWPAITQRRIFMNTRITTYPNKQCKIYCSAFDKSTAFVMIINPRCSAFIMFWNCLHVNGCLGLHIHTCEIWSDCLIVYFLIKTTVPFFVTLNFKLWYKAHVCYTNVCIVTCRRVRVTKWRVLVACVYSVARCLSVRCLAIHVTVYILYRDGGTC
jgi:hypothetical protein